MKKYLIFLVIFFSLFIGIKNTKALVILEDENYITSYQGAAYKRKIELNNNVLTFTGEYKDNGQSTYRTINVTYTLTYDNFYMQCVRGNYSGAFILLIESNNNIYADTSNSPARIRASSPYKITYINLATNSANNMTDSYISYNSQTSYGQFRLSNQDIYNNNNELFFQKNIIESYDYEQFINCNGISKIEVNFQIPINQQFDFDLEFLSNFTNESMPKPYLEYIANINNTSTLQINNFTGNIEDTESEDINGNEIYQYSGTVGITWTDLTNLKIIIDVSSYIDDYYLNLNSNIPFTITTVSVIDELNYLQTIDMNNIYGIYMIPKTLNQDIESTIWLNGTYNIEIRKDYNSQTNEYTVYKSYSNYNEPYLQNIYSLTDLNYLIFIQNPNIYTNDDSNYTITFDTRYYTYQIKEQEYSQVSIINPNNNETFTPTPIDNVKNSDYNKENLIDNIVNNFNNASYLKTNINNTFNTLVGSKLGRYIMLIITISIIAIYIRMIKK